MRKHCLVSRAPVFSTSARLHFKEGTRGAPHPGQHSAAYQAQALFIEQGARVFAPASSGTSKKAHGAHQTQ
eukprot:1137748-Pelagomonas_calceolata.AAC.1